MSNLEEFTRMLTGKFNNEEQFKEMEEKGIEFPFARHVNTVCNGKINNIPPDFRGVFIVEESYYTTNGKTHSSPHIFLFIEDCGNIILSSYDIPEGYDKNTFTYEGMGEVDFSDLKESKKFTPATYVKRNGIWEGGSESMFTPTLKFILFERFSDDFLEVSETMEMNGKRTFGYDEPIIYKRVSDFSF